MTRRERMAAGLAVVVATALAAAGASVAAGGIGPEDDLTVVKRAVAARSATQAAPETREVVPEGEGPRAEATRRPRTLGKEPTWLKVRVTEKGSSRKKVTINLPLALVKAVGNDWPRIDFDCGDRRYARCGIRISEILAALESGQELVEVDDEDSLVRIWVE